MHCRGRQDIVEKIEESIYSDGRQDKKELALA